MLCIAQHKFFPLLEFSKANQKLFKTLEVRPNRPHPGTLTPAASAVEAPAAETSAMESASETALATGGKPPRCASMIEAAKGAGAHSGRAAAEPATTALVHPRTITKA